MDFNAPVKEQAMTLLRKLMSVQTWVETGDPRAKPYLDAGAVVKVDGHIEFNRERFIECYVAELTSEHMVHVERIIATTKAVLAKEHNLNHGH